MHPRCDMFERLSESMSLAVAIQEFQDHFDPSSLLGFAAMANTGFSSIYCRLTPAEEDDEDSRSRSRP